MKKIAFVCLFVTIVHVLFAQTYRVGIATYTSSQVPSSIQNSGLSGVFRKVDQNKLFHYYLGDFETEQEAKEERISLLMKGFIDAKVIDLEEQKLWCGSPCPYFKDDFVYNHIGSDGSMVGSVFFLQGGSRVSRVGTKTIFEFAKILKVNPSFRLHLGGHTDRVGSKKANIYMASKRLRSVIALLKKYGVDSDRITPVVFGEGMPLGGDPKYDRRVVLTVIDSTGQVVSRNRATLRNEGRSMSAKK